jgi:hypothetical protein
LNLDIGVKTSKIDPTPSKPMREATEAIARGVCNGLCSESRDTPEEQQERANQMTERTGRGVLFCKDCRRFRAREIPKTDQSKCPTCLNDRMKNERKSKVPCRICVMIYRLREQGCNKRIKDQLNRPSQSSQTDILNPEWLLEVMRERMDNPPRARIQGRRSKKRRQRKPSAKEQERNEQREQRKETRQKRSRDESNEKDKRGKRKRTND